MNRAALVFLQTVFVVCLVTTFGFAMPVPDAFEKRPIKWDETSVRRSSRPFGETFLSSMMPNAADDCPGTPIPPGFYTPASPFVDTGDTRGANDTVTRLLYSTDEDDRGTITYYYYESHGPDRIYSFVPLTAGPAATITVTTTSPTYRPMIYLTEGCPAGQGNVYGYPRAVEDSGWSMGNTVTIDVSSSYLRLGYRYSIFVDSSTAGDAGPYTLTLKDMQISSAVPVRVNRPDFDGDGRADLAVYRPTNSTWYIDRSSQGFTAIQFGNPTDQIVPEDYDGDGKTDVATFRSGEWWILRSSDSMPEVIRFGQAGDIPVPADYSGDGRAEIAVFRNGYWWTYNRVNGQTSVFQFGQPGDRPVPADYSGDGRSDIAVFRNGEWWIYDLPTTQVSVTKCGQAGDQPVPAYYYDDDRVFPAVFHDGTWHECLSDHFTQEFNWGLLTDIPMPINYYGDRHADLAIYRNGVWWIKRPWVDQTTVMQFGLPGDIPVAAAYIK